MKVKCESHPGYDGINDCFLNAARIVKDRGGSAVVGWLVYQMNPSGKELIHHCVWQKPDGEMVDITPQYTWDQQRQPLDDTVEFLPDEEARLNDKDYRPLPNKHVPEGIDKDATVCEFMNRAQERFYRREYDKGMYWVSRALKADGRFKFTSPDRREWKMTVPDDLKPYLPTKEVK